MIIIRFILAGLLLWAGYGIHQLRTYTPPKRHFQIQTMTEGCPPKYHDASVWADLPDGVGCKTYFPDWVTYELVRGDHWGWACIRPVGTYGESICIRNEDLKEVQN